MNMELEAPSRELKMIRVAGGNSVFGVHAAKVDMEPSEEELVDYSSKFPEAMEEPKARPEPASYQEDDVPRVYCTEGTPRHISRASSAGDLSGGDKRRQPETIHEQDEVKLASHTATANATPQVWSRSSSPSSLSSFCLNGQPVDDAHSVISEFSRQPSGIISPSDLPDSPGQTMPPSPNDRRRNPSVYTSGSEQSKQFRNSGHSRHSTQHVAKFADYGYLHQTVHEGNSQQPQSSHFTPISIDETKMEATTSIPPLVRPHPEPRQMRTYADSKMVGDPYMQEDSLHNYRTEDTPANLSAATSFSDLSSICPKSDYHGPVPRPRCRKPVTPLPLSPGNSQMPLETAHAPDLFNTLGQPDIVIQRAINAGNPQEQQQPPQQQQHQQHLQPQQKKGVSERSFDDQKPESSYSWKPRTFPRKVRQNPAVNPDESFAHGNANKSMPDLNKDGEDNQDSDSNSEDDELLRQVINRGRPARSNNSSSLVGNKPISPAAKTQKNGPDREVSSDSESDSQEIIDELIKAGRPASRGHRHCMIINDLSLDPRDPRGYQASADKLKQDKLKSARSMENLNSPSRTVKKGSTNFRVREQPLRGAEGAIPKQNITRAQSMKSNKSLGYDQMHDRRQTKTPDPSDMLTRCDPSTSHMFQNKPVSKVSPMRSQTQHRDQPSTSFATNKVCHGVGNDVSPKQVLLSPVRNSVRQSSKTCLKRTTEPAAGENSESSGEEYPPRPPKPPQYRAPPRPADFPTSEVIGSSPELINTSTPDIIPSISRANGVPAVHDDLATVQPLKAAEENNNIHNEDKVQIPPEPPEDCGNITVLSFKFTDSNRTYTRRFLRTNQFHSVVNYLHCKGFPPNKYKIVTSGLFMLKREVTENCFGKTLVELKMVPKKTLTVRPR
ncbi:hypothetical protein BIW11_05559 [Tropilaelaps mercedesae]|uniref:UBX domain-containing protein n=1 Tax=Tropilaelaps mercedesae TaxID=418985 RepID=A0A1V9Y1V0_9ACAR|nr:hypothetical protein BIW11_05559 [Tropilaelaps mercedesae]